MALVGGETPIWCKTMVIRNGLATEDSKEEYYIGDDDEIRLKYTGKILGGITVDKPSYDYKEDDTAWTFYNHVTHALKKSYPRSWMSDQQKFHQFMISELFSVSQLKPNDSSDMHVEDHEIVLPDGRTIDELDAAEPMNETDDWDDDWDGEHFM